MSFKSQDTLPEEPSKPYKPLTASSIASDYFTKELESHSDSARCPETVVIVHDACYGHRFSRLKTSKSMLSMIVERPERIRASVLGLSAAYVRLGSRHLGGEHAPVVDGIPPSDFPFAIRKSARALSLLDPAVVAVHGKDWMDELAMMCASAGQRLEQGERELERPKQLDAQASQSDKAPFHEGDLYLCQESLDAFQGALGGVCDAVDATFDTATSTKRAFVAIRPPGHHCSSDFPSGFCWLNNVHVGIEYAAQTYGLTHAAILDFDLHHGDGSQEITWARNEKSAAMPKNAPYNKKVAIGYYSMHDINSFPCEAGDRTKVQNASLCIDNAHGQSVWNVHLEPWTTPDEFWRLYETKYLVLLEKARKFLRGHASRIKATPRAIQPKAAIFISAGFDASEHEGAGMQRHAVNVPTEFYARFTNDVVKLAEEEGTAVEGRVISVLEGGYSDRALASGVMSHISGLCQTTKSRTKQTSTSDGSNDMSSLIDGQSSVRSYDPQWWHSDLLTALEQYITPPPPPQAKKGRSWLPTFATPTESFANKVVDPDKLYRSISGTMRPIEELKVDPASLAVNWIVATHELSKLIIPTDRTTTSCKPEDLVVARTKKPRHSNEAPVSAMPANGGRQLRDRRTKAPEYFGPASDDESSSIKTEVSLASLDERRKTIGALPVAETIPAESSLPRQPIKELSAVSDADTSLPVELQAPPMPSLPTPTFPEPKPKAAPRSPRGKTAKLPAIKPSVAAHTLLPPASLTSRPATNVRKPEPFRTYSVRTPKTEMPASSKEGTPEMDRLTSGIKRITLKVPSREEHDRRQREREEAERAAQEAKKKPRKTVVPRAKKPADALPQTVVKQKGNASISEEKGQAALASVSTLPVQRPPAESASDSSASVSGPSPAAVAVSGEGLTPIPFVPAVFDATASAQADARDLKSLELPMPPASEPSVQSTHNPTDVASSSTAHQAPPLVPATPIAGLPAQSAYVPDTAARQLLSEHQASQWRPEHAEPPARQSQPPPIQFGRANLPVFSSTGSIPFGPSAPSSDHAAGAPMPLLSPNGHHTLGNGVSRSMLDAGDISATASPEKEKTKDIWEIPETPAKRQ
ncbi:hypothetical protein MBLNU457_3478t1 [Dothideomycetes sp. NU457]